MGIRVRPGHLDDAAIIALLGRITFSETFDRLFVDNPGDLASHLKQTFSIAKIRESIGDTDNHYWLIFNDDLPVGYAKLKHRSPMKLVSSFNCAQLQKIYVLRDFLGQRLGERLLEAMLEQAASLFAEVTWLSVLRQNERALRFYRKHGFERVGPETFTIGKQTFDFDVLARARSQRF